MFKKLVPVLAATALIATAAPSARAFDVGGANGWKLSTDGIVDVFAVYETTTPMPGGNRAGSLLNNSPTQDQRFGVMVGLLPSVVGLNVTAPTTNGVDSTVRVGIYPSIQNKGPAGAGGARFNVDPNIDFREIFYTAKGSAGELLAGRALNLYQGKNILTDMTLLTAGVVPVSGTSTTLGHIGYGYLYTNFGPQIRYTTPDMGGIKVAFAVAEPYNISQDTAKTNTPRLEAEVSYAAKMKDVTLQAWASGLWQTATRNSDPGTPATPAIPGTTNLAGQVTSNFVPATAGTPATARPGALNTSIGGAAGFGAGFAGIDLLASGYYGSGLGMVSVQDGVTDLAGKERTAFGYLVQATYKLTPAVKLGLNYGSSNQERSDGDKALGFAGGTTPMRKQEAAVAMVAYNFNAFTQFVVETAWAQNTWMDGAKQHSNAFNVGTMFYW